MSLRPSERVEVRRNRYKVAVDAEEGRRRREDNMVEIRKNRREESLLKRRREGLQAQVPAPPSGVEKKVRIRRPLRSLFRFLSVFFFIRCCDGILVLGLCRDWTSVQYKCGRSVRMLSNAKILYYSPFHAYNTSCSSEPVCDYYEYLLQKAACISDYLSFRVFGTCRRTLSYL